MILVEFVTGTPSFIQMKVSGGDPDEVQVKVKEEPIVTSMVDNGYLVITGEAGGYTCIIANKFKHYKETYFCY